MTEKSRASLEWDVQQGIHYTQQSAITLKPVTGDVNNIDCLVTLAPDKGWDILDSRQILKLICHLQMVYLHENDVKVPPISQTDLILSICGICWMKLHIPTCRIVRICG